MGRCNCRQWGDVIVAEHPYREFKTMLTVRWATMMFEDYMLVTTRRRST